MPFEVNVPLMRGGGTKLREVGIMPKRHTAIILAVLSGFILVGSLCFALDTQAGELFRNTVGGSAGLAIPLPDLVVSRIELLTMTANSLDYLVVIENIGEAAAQIVGEPGYEDDVNFQGYLSQDPVLGGLDDRGGGGRYLLEPAELAPGEAYTYPMSIGTGEDYAFDYSTLFVEVDAVKHLGESNEDNNINWITLPDGPDLVVESVQVLNINSTAIVYQFTVRNIGDGMADLDGPDDVGWADNVNFRGVLSPDDILDNFGDKGAGGAYLNPPFDPVALNPGEAFTKSYAAGMGGANYLDFHYLFVEIDGFDNLGETNESNNVGLTQVPRFIYLPLVLR